MTARQLAGRCQKRHRDFLAQVSSDELFNQCQPVGRKTAGDRLIKPVVDVVQWVVHDDKTLRNILESSSQSSVF
ncbi:hypothetical protein AO242_02410 [Pseudomonas sp. ICMP 561]|nr:hypothetical protein AO242_02410 [Pseudomonas sp. ICMP 561]